MSVQTQKQLQALITTTTTLLEGLHHQLIDDQQAFVLKLDLKLDTRLEMLTDQLMHIQQHLNRQDDERRLIRETVQRFGTLSADLTQRVTQLEQTVEMLGEELASVQRQRTLEAES